MTNVFGRGTQKNNTTLLDWVSRAQRGEEITIWGRGKRVVQYIYIEDVMKVILASGSLRPGIWNIGGRNYRPVGDVARFISKLFGVRVRFLLDRKEGEMLPEIDTRRIRQEILEIGSESLEEEIGDYIEQLGS